MAPTSGDTAYGIPWTVRGELPAVNHGQVRRRALPGVQHQEVSKGRQRPLAKVTRPLAYIM